jgi:hypothetical protein
MPDDDFMGMGDVTEQEKKLAQQQAQSEALRSGGLPLQLKKGGMDLSQIMQLAGMAAKFM